MKALWEFDTRLLMCLDSQMEIVFVISLSKECIRLIGLKSFATSDTSVSGMRIMFAPLSFSRGPARSSWKQLLAACTSLLMMDQQCL